MAINIVFFSYGKLTEQINKIKATYPEEINFLIIETNIDHVLDAALDMEKRHNDAIYISSGANAELIRGCKELRTPFVEICPTGFDLLTAINNAKAFSNKIGIITFKEKMPYLDLVKNISNLNIVEKIYYSTGEIRDIVDEFCAMGINDLICGSLIGEAARKKGMRVHFLWSEPAIRFAIDKAISIAKVIKETTANNERLKTILNFAHEGIIFINPAGDIEILNASAEKIIGVSERDSIGRNITKIFKNIKMDDVIKNNRKVLNRILDVADIKILTNQVPIVIQNQVAGVIITFQHIDVIQRAEEKIRKNLYTKGFAAETRFENIIGKSKVLDNLKKEAALYSKTSSTILIMGESGTGKDLLAQSIHNSSARENKPFVAINCAALPMNLLESELFGYEEGAFTGAKRGGKYGVFELAHGGTIFLDEISEISLAIQAQLLRVLERKEILRIGGQSIIKVDVRIIAATNKDLWGMVKKGAFREDLFYRLNVLELRLPPLRERKEDIPLLVAHFIKEYRKDINQEIIKNIANSIELAEYSWPGNIRELKNIIERFAVLYDDDSDAIELIKEVMFLKKTTIKESNEKSRLSMIIEECGGNKAKAARKLGVSRTTMWRKIKRYGLD